MTIQWLYHRFYMKYQQYQILNLHCPQNTIMDSSWIFLYSYKPPYVHTLNSIIFSSYESDNVQTIARKPWFFSSDVPATNLRVNLHFFRYKPSLSPLSSSSPPFQPPLFAIFRHGISTRKKRGVPLRFSADPVAPWGMSLNSPRPGLLVGFCWGKHRGNWWKTMGNIGEIHGKTMGKYWELH